MTDQELREQFERGTLPNESFRHREHVRMAFLYLTEYPALRALQMFSEALQKFAVAHGKPQLYHETITWAYILLIRGPAKILSRRDAHVRPGENHLCIP